MTNTWVTMVDTRLMQSSIAVDSVVFNFNQPYECGQYCNGDWWVVGPVTLTSITPAAEWVPARATSKGTVGCWINGTMVNPADHKEVGRDRRGGQGFDSVYSSEWRLQDGTAVRAAAGKFRMTSNGQEGKWVRVGTRLYSFSATPTTANTVRIGQNVSETLRNLAAAINGLGGDGSRFAAGTLPSKQVTVSVAGDNELTIESVHPGARANVIALDTNTNNGEFTHGRSISRYAATAGIAFYGDLNKDPGFTGISLSVPVNSSVVKAISANPMTGLYYIQKFAVLTVVSSPPPAGSFRPPVYGPNKTSRWQESMLDYSKFRSLPTLKEFTRTPDQYASEFKIGKLKNCWTFGAASGNAGRHLHAIDHVANGSGYGGDRCDHFSGGALLLHCTFTNAQKRNLLVNFVQEGIDIWGYVSGNGGAGNIMGQGGGVLSGDKLPVILAAVTLNSPDLLEWVNFKDHPNVWCYDGQLFEVSQSDVTLQLANQTRSGRGSAINWTSAEVGLVEWAQYAQSSNPPHIEGSAVTVGSSYRAIACHGESSGYLAIELIEGARQACGTMLPFYMMDRVMRFENAGCSIGNYNGPPAYGVSAYNEWRSLISRKIWKSVPERIHWFDDPATEFAASYTDIIQVDGTTATVTKPRFILDGGSKIQSYDIRWRYKTGSYDIGNNMASNSQWNRMTNIQFPYQITGLRPRSEIFVQLRAINGLGAGPWTSNIPLTSRFIKVSNVNGTFKLGQVITGGASGSTAKIVRIRGDELVLADVWGEFVLGERVTSTKVAANIANGNAMNPLLIHAAMNGKPFRVGAVITGSTSKAKATIISARKAGLNMLYHTWNPQGAFVTRETISDGTHSGKVLSAKPNTGGRTWALGTAKIA